MIQEQRATFASVDAGEIHPDLLYLSETGAIFCGACVLQAQVPVRYPTVIEQNMGLDDPQSCTYCCRVF